MGLVEDLAPDAQQVGETPAGQRLGLAAKPGGEGPVGPADATVLVSGQVAAGRGLEQVLEVDRILGRSGSRRLRQRL